MKKIVMTLALLAGIGAAFLVAKNPGWCKTTYQKIITFQAKQIKTAKEERELAQLREEFNQENCSCQQKVDARNPNKKELTCSVVR